MLALAIGAIVAVLRITRFTADPADAKEVLARNTALVAAVRAASPGPAEASLARLDDKTWVGLWRWESAADAQATFDAAHSIPETAAAFALVKDATAEQAEIIDER
jgi:quinol monooxygenase YgiN